jgi:hypothetical protein
LVEKDNQGWLGIINDNAMDSNIYLVQKENGSKKTFKKNFTLFTPENFVFYLFIIRNPPS